MKNLIIVESPTKAKTIGKFLGNDYIVTSSMGHVRDLPSKNMCIDIENKFAPQYEIPKDKQSLIKELQSLLKKTDNVWLATDEDREGESISWHLTQVLGLDLKNTKRIAFHEITKPAILEALNNPRTVDMNLVNAQQARRVLDRLVGYELSPVLWKKVQPKLSAGRVQSVAVRLIVEREREIMNFNATSKYKIVGTFGIGEYTFTAVLNEGFADKQEAIIFLKTLTGASFAVDDIKVVPHVRKPLPPFTTSTLQQDAAHKLGFSVSRTMQIAQHLYESGYISYMRTDSVNLSELAINTSRKEIESLYGKEYVKTRRYTTNSKGAQEAHEAIRPTYMDRHSAGSDDAQKRLYDLIWKRTLASQMSDALMEKTEVFISISNSPLKFIANGEVVKFDGFLKVYKETIEDDSEDVSKTSLPAMQIGNALLMNKCVGLQKYTSAPRRYNEASLVKKMENIGIGRPATYASVISTIQGKGYVECKNCEGNTRSVVNLNLDMLTGQVQETTVVEKYGVEKKCLCPTEIGFITNDFLSDSFKEIMDYNFTANVEKELDEIATGHKEWVSMIDEFYKPFHQQVLHTQTDSPRFGERFLGNDPVSGKPIYAKLTRYGKAIQIGEAAERGDKEHAPRFVSMLESQNFNDITLEEALKLIQLPRTVGTYEGQPIVVANGRFGLYLQHNGQTYHLDKKVDAFNLTEQEAIAVIEAKRKAVQDTTPHSIGVHEGEEIQVASGRFGPYLIYKKRNFSLPKNVDLATITVEDALAVIEAKNQKNVLKTFDEDESVMVLKGRFGAYLFANGENYRIPAGKDYQTMTYEDCKEIIEGASKKATKTTAKKSSASTKTTVTKKSTTKKSTTKTK